MPCRGVRSYWGGACRTVAVKFPTRDERNYWGGLPRGWRGTASTQGKRGTVTAGGAAGYHLVGERVQSRRSDKSR